MCLAVVKHHWQSNSVLKFRLEFLRGMAGRRARQVELHGRSGLSVVGHRSNDLQLGSTVNTATSMHNGDFGGLPTVVGAQVPGLLFGASMFYTQVDAREVQGWGTAASNRSRRVGIPPSNKMGVALSHTH